MCCIIIGSLGDLVMSEIARLFRPMKICSRAASQAALFRFFLKPIS
jgi:hypothetical protein